MKKHTETKWITQNPEETIALGEQIVNKFPEITVIGIEGPLGSGKTHLVKGMGQALGLSQDMIKSPTFLTLMEHDGVRRLLHFDFYRHEHPEATLTEWWQEHLNHPNALVVVEWPEHIPHNWPRENSLLIEIKVLGDQKRQISILNS